MFSFLILDIRYCSHRKFFSVYLLTVTCLTLRAMTGIGITGISQGYLTLCIGQLIHAIMQIGIPIPVRVRVCFWVWVRVRVRVRMQMPYRRHGNCLNYEFLAVVFMEISGIMQSADADSYSYLPPLTPRHPLPKHIHMQTLWFAVSLGVCVCVCIFKHLWCACVCPTIVCGCCMTYNMLIATVCMFAFWIIAVMCAVLAIVGYCW